MRKRTSSIPAIALALAASTSTAAWSAPAPPPVAEAVGLRVTELGLDFVEGEVAPQYFVHTVPVISKGGLLCYDSVGINNAVIELDLDDVDLEFVGSSSALDVTVDIPTVSLTGELFAQDSDFFDACPSFDTNIDLIQLSGVVFTTQLNVTVDAANNLHFTFVAPPTITFENIIIDVDPIWDTVENLIFSAEFVQDFILEKLNEVLQARVPAMLEESPLQALFAGEAASFGYEIGISSISIDDGGGNFVIDVGLSSPAPVAACAASSPPPTFVASGPLGLGSGGDLSMLEVSITDAIVNEGLYVAWSTGMLCLEGTHPSLESFEALLSGLVAGADEALDYSITVGTPPSIRFEGGTATIDIDDFLLEAYSSFAGEQALLFRIDADFTTGASIDIDVATNRILVSMDTFNVDFRRIESDVIFSSSPSAESDLISFVTGFVLPILQARFREVPVSNAVIYAADYVMLFDDIRIIPGHALAELTLFAADDPSLDRVPPETYFTQEPPQILTETETTVSFDGSDDRLGELVFSWKVDGGGWSSWKTDRTADLSALPEGPHTVYVKSRDRFLNEDPTPAMAGFTVVVATDDDEPLLPEGGELGGCACNLTAAAGIPSGSAAFGLLVIGLFLALAARRRGA